jgi:nitrite reductase/ring-hydroxylating ferredoxin subunit
MADLDDPGARGFDVGPGAWPLQMFVVRNGDAVWGYVNRCPHAGHPLNWLPDRFLSPDATLIQCASHGARFAIDTGLCVLGPCPGRSLTRVPLHKDGADIFLSADSVETLRPRAPRQREH